MRILVAGFQHETNTFAPTKAVYENFLKGEGHPAMARSEALLSLRDINIPIGGFIKAALAEGHEIVPVIWAAASPSAHVTQDAFERIAGEILDAADRQTFDAIYLDLHGAMVTEDLDDGEGELLARLRGLVGSKIPVVASLDLHANVTKKMLSNADGLVAYRTYPHVDMADTGEAVAMFLKRFLLAREAGKRVVCKWRRLPFLIPINGMCTQLEPARTAYRDVAASETDSVLSVSFAPGFPAADFPECGPVVWGYGTEEAVLEKTIGQLVGRFTRDELAWAVPFLAPEDAVAEAILLSQLASRPVVIADTQDNPGAGGDSNTMGMLRALLTNQAKGAAIGLIWDPEAARAAHQAGEGASLHLALGGRSGVSGDNPLEAVFEVETLSDGRLVFDGPMLNGVKVELGPVACLRIDDVRVVVSSVKSQMLDRNLYRVAGIQPEAMKILVNKSSVHFRADFEPIAEKILIAKAPGPMAADPADYPWTRLAPGIRTSPGGKAFAT
ncbi:MAG TPA: M81 family metallopeptidase [Acidocella sp.]|uniref:M81 family metallopeptidase n=1 Tax=Acidocella sp. TaxID=50710 RepID=UPI002C316EC8|nr:M81 family metallopeptidase [Acidocella sp.]HVE23514.1 M81 family metallopeptidase [Acidocella sp.]